jgi:hypothetical protein
MSHLKKNVYDLLEKSIPFRERKNKDKGIVIILYNRYPVLKTSEIKMDIMIEILKDYTTMDRAWRYILDKERSDLRGLDYAEKDKLEQDKMLDIGYEVGSSINKEVIKKVNEEKE